MHACLDRARRRLAKISAMSATRSIAHIRRKFRVFVVVRSERTLLGRLGITSSLGVYTAAEDDGRFVQRPLVS